IFTDLAIGPFTIHLNNRKLMRGFFEDLGVSDPDVQVAVLREVDKLDKRGPEHVRTTLTGVGFGLSGDAVEQILTFVAVRSTSHADAMAVLDRVVGGSAGSEAVRTGVAERWEVLNLVRDLGVPESDCSLYFSIACGLDNYTVT